MLAVKQLLSVNTIIAVTTLLGVASNLVAAAFFGLSRGMDAYFAALIVPNLIIAVSVGYMGKNFLPIYSRLMEDDIGRVDQFVSTLINLAGILGLALTGLLWYAASDIFRLMVPGFESATLTETTKMFGIVATAITPMIINVFHSYLLQYQERYTTIAIGGLILPLSILLSLGLLSSIVNEYALAIGFAFGQWFMFIFFMIRSRYDYQPIVGLSDPHVKQILLNTGILTLTGIISRLQMVLVRTFGSQLGEGVVAAISLAERVCKPLRNTAFQGIRMIMLSKSSRLVAQGKTNAAGALYKDVIVATLLATIPIAVWIFVNAHQLIDLLFLRGAFDSDMSRLVAIALIGLLPTIVLMPTNTILSNSMYVMNRITVPAVLGVFSTVLFIAFVYLTVDKFEILGVTLGQSVPYIVTFPILGFFLHRYLDSFVFSEVLKKSITYVALAILSFGSITLVAGRIDLTPISRVVFTGLFGGILYFAVLVVFRDSGLEYTVRKVTDAFRKN